MHSSAERGSAESKTNRRRHSTAHSSRHTIDFLVEISVGVDAAVIGINFQLIFVPFGGDVKAVGQ